MEILEQTPAPSKTYRNDLLKIVALVTMLIDHIGYMYFPHEMMFRTIGRIAFPIFAYQVALGFQKTSSKEKYAKRLFIFALISQVPYTWFNPELSLDWQGLNIMFTLLYSLGALQILEFSKIQWTSVFSADKQSPIKAVVFSLLTVLLIALPDVMYFNTGISLEYGSVGVMFVLLFYIFGKHFLPMLIAYVLLSGFGAYYSAAKWLHYSTGDSLWKCITSYKTIYDYHIYYGNTLNTMSGIFFQARSVMAIPIIGLMNLLENHTQLNIHLNKYVGYLFYPVHIAILVGIKFVLITH